MPDNPTSADVVAEARTWIDTPYRHHGREKGKACDCVGLGIGVGEAVLGRTLYERFDYSDHPKAEKLLAEVDARMDVQEGRVAADMRHKVAPKLPELFPGEVVALYVNEQKLPQHLGIIGEFDGRLTLIHGTNKIGKVVEHTLSKFWHERVCRVYRYPGVAY